MGLITGTSVDGIDAALVSFEPDITCHAACTLPWPDELRHAILSLAQGDGVITLDELGALDTRIAQQFARAAITLLEQAAVPPAAVRAIGSHGQTVRHRPHGDAPFSMQLGNPALIAELTGIDCVADFRSADLAAGGQGAPLLPALHAALFAKPEHTSVVLNLGGIANITVLHGDGRVAGFDTGPANALLDAWAMQHLGSACDVDGAFAARGQVDSALLDALLSDPYFHLPPPKSTGRETFHLHWLNAHLPSTPLTPENVQATLAALTVRSVADAIHQHASAATRVLVCGGGVHNPLLMAQLRSALAPRDVISTAEVGIDPDHIEAMAFAWLAQQRLAGQPGNLPSVTGARGPRVLGTLALASK
ncbi:MAG: anhydro-N-acetylmuramic acid kinase [Xanthomonadales bacterium]|nr:anhydro-N-acetylmuramic acid kinase [Xanthomonadales bacterium]